MRVNYRYRSHSNSKFKPEGCPPMQYLMASELVFLHWIKISFYGVIEMWTRLLQPVLDKCACGTVYDATKPFLFGIISTKRKRITDYATGMSECYAILGTQAITTRLQDPPVVSHVQGALSNMPNESST